MCELKQSSNPQCNINSVFNGSYHILSVGGGGMLTARVPESSLTSTASRRGVLDISSIFFFMYSFSLAFWKYFDLAILSTNFKIRLLVLPPAAALQEAKWIFHQMALIYFKKHFWQRTQKKRQRLSSIGIIHQKLCRSKPSWLERKRGYLARCPSCSFPYIESEWRLWLSLVPIHFHCMDKKQGLYSLKYLNILHVQLKKERFGTTWG